MITAIDTSVLLDVFTDDPLFCDRSLDAIRRSLAEGPLLACDVVWAEVIAAFPDPAAAEAALSRLPVAFSGMSQTAATKAGIAWRAYRQAGGPRERLMTDFVVGAHALEHADRLLTRDRGFQRAAFEGLTIIDPSG